ncbi:MAG: hypothetical protein LBG57_12145 [Treponema sp.]|nr:hypothetical protein [Treponema sp.]
MKTKKSQFITKTSVKALINSPRIMRQAGLSSEEMAKAEISRKTTELAGAFPYIFSIASSICETFPHLVKEYDHYYQLGTEADPITWELFQHYGIGKHKKQKHLFLVELKRLILENRPYWMPTGNGRMAFTQPFRIILIADERKIDGEELKRLKNTELADYVISGVILECYKPLFAGHFNGYRDGFIKQPAAWYAKIRKSVAGMIENKARFDGIAESGAEPENDMTALNVMKVWEYLALHDNGKGKTKTVNVIDMLSHVAPSYLQKGEYIRTEFIGSLFNALIALAKLTHEYRDELDFEITSLEVDQFDRAYAVNHGYREGTALFMVEALKHHLKAHNNTLILQVSRNGGPGHDRE